MKIKVVLGIPMKAVRWCSGITLIAAIGLLSWPWLPMSWPPGGESLGAEPLASEIGIWHAWLVGGILVLLAVLSLFRQQPWLASLRLVVGIWLAISPLALDLGSGLFALLTHVALGFVVAAVAAFELYSAFRRESEVLSHLS